MQQNMMPIMNPSSLSFFTSLVLVLQFIVVVCLARTSRTSIFTDKEALLAIKANINANADNNILEGNWSSSSTFVCSWVGITCSTRHNRVIELNIPGMQLSGPIAPHIGNLSFLVSLNMSSNAFNGNLPQEMGRLRRLRMLDLSGNNITGNIPSFIGDLQNLQECYLDRNQLKGHVPNTLFNSSSLLAFSSELNSLSGPLPVSMCNYGHQQLVMLNLHGNSLDGQIPRSMGRCTSLEFLALSENRFSGNIPTEMGNLTSLSMLFLGSNKLEGNIPVGIFEISSMIILQLSWNNLTGNIPTFDRLPNLEELIIQENYLEGPIPSSISNSSRLREMFLFGNMLSGPIPHTLGNLSSLELLILHTNNFTNHISSSSELSIITSLTNCKKLIYLSLSHNPLKGTLPKSIGNFSSALTNLAISRGQLRGRIPGEIGNLKNLINLILTGNEFEGNIPSTIGKLHQLQSLKVRLNKLNGSFPDALCNVLHLSFVDLSQNEFTGPLPECLGNMPSLRELLLSENSFSSPIPNNLWNLKNLLQLNLSMNSFSESLGTKMVSMEALTRLDLSSNRFSGNIPSSIGELKNLVAISLAQNRLEGSIPESLESIPDLQFLNLAVNNLSGVIPESLESLDTLSYFNVSFNKLEGEIPSGGPFKNYTRESFMSNQGLCGNPKLNFPPCPTNNPFHKSSKRKRVLIIVFSSLAVAMVLITSIVIFTLMRKFRIRKAITQPEISTPTNFERISYLELQHATNGFSDTNLLGRGSFGSVYKAAVTSGEVYAVKVFQLQRNGAFASFERECEILRNIRHRNLVKVISSCANLDFKSLVLQYMPNGSLEKWLYNESSHLDFLQRLNVMIDVACALGYLHQGHSTPIVHCDLKPSNVLLDEDMVGHVSDFGISKLLGEEDYAHTKTLATFGYMAPEYGTDGLVSTRCDVYSFGILLMEVFTEKSPSDEMFSEDLSLRSWVADEKDNLILIICRDILKAEEEQLNTKMQLVSSIIDLGLTCSEVSPNNRMDMTDAEASLRKIKAVVVERS